MKNITAIFSFILLVVLANVSVLRAQYVCQPAANPIEIQGSLNAGDVQQAGRITRDGKPPGVKASVGLNVRSHHARRQTFKLRSDWKRWA